MSEVQIDKKRSYSLAIYILKPAYTVMYNLANNFQHFETFTAFKVFGEIKTNKLVAPVSLQN